MKRMLKDSIDDIFQAYLKEISYREEFCRQLCKMLAEMIKSHASEILQDDNYKIISRVFIGEPKIERIKMMYSRTVSVPDQDHIAHSSYENDTIVAFGMVAAVAATSPFYC